jgi:hypothetical protein
MKEELIYGQRLAMDEGSRAPVWMVGASTTATSVFSPSSHQERPLAEQRILIDLPAMRKRRVFMLLLVGLLIIVAHGSAIACLSICFSKLSDRDSEKLPGWLSRASFLTNRPFTAILDVLFHLPKWKTV